MFNSLDRRMQTKRKAISSREKKDPGRKPTKRREKTRRLGWGQIQLSGEREHSVNRSWRSIDRWMAGQEKAELEFHGQNEDPDTSKTHKRINSRTRKRGDCMYCLYVLMDKNTILSCRRSNASTANHEPAWPENEASPPITCEIRHF